MEDVAEEAVKRVVEMMRNRLDEELTIDDLARVAMFSKFHFSRMFQRVTGLSPGRFLSALRLQEAKRLLVSTSLSVTEISHRVGYTSVGTFSSRFSRSVGVSPSTYRHLGGFTKRIAIDDGAGLLSRRPVELAGRVAGPEHRDLGPIFLGLFATRLPQGTPVRCAILDRPGGFRLEDVPDGRWYLLVHSVGAEHQDLGSHAGEDVFVATKGPIEVAPGGAVLPVDVSLRPMRSIDPPLLMALLDVRSAAMAVRAG